LENGREGGPRGAQNLANAAVKQKCNPLNNFLYTIYFHFLLSLYFFFAQFSFVKRVWGPNAPRIFHAPMHAILRGHMKIITKKIETKIETSTGILIPQEINH